ncbi:hypothetical protein MMC30_009070 [Trapelia coarctata]|nr:hypothetical protein [Trapelia coarctata]
MANLSQVDRAIIAKYPLESSLTHLHDSLRKVEQTYEPDSTSYDDSARKAISRLLYALQGHEVALDLQSKTGNKNLDSELSTLYRRVRNGDFKYQHYYALARLVVKQASDLDIWNAVFDLITTVSRVTPPASIPPSFDGTPIIHSSASQQGAEQTRRLLDERISEEISRCTYRNVGGFFQKYFEGKEWSNRSKDIYKAMKSRHVDGRWIDFPDPPVQNAVWEWLRSFQDKFLSGTQDIYYTTRSTKDLTGAEARRQLDLFIKRKSNAAGPIHDWKDVRVIGEHKQSEEDLKPLLLQLGRYMRDVFTAQPTRRFIHGFFLYGTIMELWVFDRSGPYSSGEFDIHEEPEQFIRAIAGYAMMSDEELGLDTFVERDGGDLFITITEDANGKEKRIQLERDPMVIQRAIVCRGTSCYRSKDGDHVVKFSWTSDKRPPEADHLRLAREKGVQGVAGLLGYHRITSIERLRHGLTFPAPNHFRFTSPSASFSSQQSHLGLAQSFGSFQSFSIADNTLRKRKSDDNVATPLKRSRSNSQRSKLNLEHKANQALGTTQTTKGKSVSYKAKSPKRSRSNSQRSKLQHENKAIEALENTRTRERKPVDNETKLFKKPTFISQRSQSRQEHEVSQALENTEATSLYDPSDGSFENRLFCCLAISPAGRAISEFDSILELLTALRDAIKAHKSLYIQGGILHRDISENNIIITDPKKADGFTGMLIDLDLAKIVGSGRSGARHQTGTMQFIAIGVLRKVAHTYRHDLESFFYVLLWISARRAWDRFGSWFEGRPKQSRLTKWYTGSFDDIAEAKEGHMRLGRFEYILTEFPRAFARIKPLCRAVRGILYHLLEDGELDIGTPSDPENLYDSIIKAFDNAIANMAAEEDS